MVNPDEPALVERLDDVRRDGDLVARLWVGARIMTVDPAGRFEVRRGLDGVRLDLVPSSGAYDAARHWLVGRVEGSVVFCQAGESATGVTLREVGPELRPAQVEGAAIAVALAHWHRLESRCPGCGGETTVRAAGTVRYCRQDDRELFPRTDPAVIVAVVDSADRLLLAHQRVWPEGRHSVLAGFVEAGESLEQAVRREVLEEVGVRLGQVRYVASQPWPFPRSIMLGFTARAETTEIAVDGEEIASALWVSRSELTDAVRAGEMTLPTSVSIAHRLIQAWWHANDAPVGEVPRRRTERPPGQDQPSL